MKTSSVSFAQLRRLLLDLRFRETRKNDYIRFEHPKTDTVFLFRSYAPNDNVTVQDLVATGTQLDWRGLLYANPFDDSQAKKSETMKIASVAHLKSRLSSYLKASATTPVVVTRNGRAVAVLLGVNDDNELERLLPAHSWKLRAILDAADCRIDVGAGLTHAELWHAVESGKRAREGKEPRKRHPAKTVDDLAIELLSTRAIDVR